MAIPNHTRKIFAWVRHRFPGARMNGNEVVIRCPFCGKDNHCSINPWKNRYHCFRCGAGRNTTALSLMRDLEREMTPAMLNQLAADFDMSSIGPMLDKPTALKDAAVLPPEYIPLFSLLRDADRSPLVDRAIAYVRRRRITDSMLINYRIGVCLDGKYARRIIIPIVLNGEAVSFVARLFIGHGMRYLTPPGQLVKVPPSELLFNWDSAQHANPIKITEGVFDAIALGESATSLLGKSLHQGQLAKFSLVMPRAIEIWLDPDAWTDALDAMKTFQTIGASVTVMRLHGGDPSETGGANAERNQITTLAQSFALRWQEKSGVSHE